MGSSVPASDFSKMRREIDLPGKSLPPEVIAFSPKENLASRMLQVLEKAPETGKTYNLREANEFLNQLAKERGIEKRVSYGTLQKWVVITLGEIIEPIASLSQEELTSKLFREKFPDEKDLLLSPTALFSFTGHMPRCALGANDLQNVLAWAASQKKIEPNYRSVRTTLQVFRDKCFSFQEIAIILKGKYKYQGGSQEFPKKLDRSILNGTLPLNNYPTILARAIGIPKEFFEQELEKQWKEAPSLVDKRKKEKIHPRAALHYPERFTPFSNFLRPFLETRGVKLSFRYVPLLTLYFKEKGIDILSYKHKATGATYYVLSLEAQEEIKRLLENEETTKEIERIASQGFTLEEYTQIYRHHFPDGAPISITEAIRLAGGPKILTTKRRIESIKELLKQKGIFLEEKTLTLRKRKTKFTYLPIERLTKAVEILKETSLANPTLFRSVWTLYKRGEASTLTSILREAFPKIKICTKHLRSVYEQHLVDIDGIYRTRQGRSHLHYLALNTRRQAIIEEIGRRQEGIIQTLEMAKKNAIIQP